MFHVIRDTLFRVSPNFITFYALCSINIQYIHIYIHNTNRKVNVEDKKKLNRSKGKEEEEGW